MMTGTLQRSMRQVEKALRAAAHGKRSINVATRRNVVVATNGEHASAEQYAPITQENGATESRPE